MLRLLTVAACVLAVGGAFAIPRLGFAGSAPPDKAAALRRLGAIATTDSNTKPVAPPDPVVRSIPARMLGPDAPTPIPPAVLRVRNGWLASDGRTLVAVYAGSAGDDPSVGRLVVVRQNLVSGNQTVRIVAPDTTGALAIAGAPLGLLAKTAALRIRTTRGRLLRLDLDTDTVAGSTLTRSSRTAATVTHRLPPRSSDQVSHPPGR
ncbi:MAG TPA: hypothetical protein VGH46_12640 [Gaiellaceae bacterium]